VIGSGAGGGTLVRHLAPSGKRILLLERGDWLPREPQNLDFGELRHYDGISPAWPVSYEDMEPYNTSSSRAGPRTARSFCCRRQTPRTPRASRTRRTRWDATTCSTTARPCSHFFDEVRADVPERSSAIVLLAAPEHVDDMIGALEGHRHCRLIRRHLSEDTATRLEEWAASSTS